MTGIERGDELVAGFARVVATLRAAEHTAPPDPAAVPVTLLTGFLGAGKTTVLRTLLVGSHGLRITAIVNDLAGVNVDAIELGDVGDRFELANGCACCARTDELADALVDAAGSAPDAIVVEASGAADAVAIAAVVEGTAGVRLDGVVAVVDGSSWFDRAGCTSAVAALAQRQLDTAHLVLVSKLDRCDPGVRDRVLAAVAADAPGRRVVATDRGWVEPFVLLEASVHGAAIRPPTKLGHVRFAVRSLPMPEPVAEIAVAEWLDRPHGLLRAKGWFRGLDGVTMSVQAVGRRWTIEPAGVDREPVLVLIAETAEVVDAAESELRSLRR